MSTTPHFLKKYSILMVASLFFCVIFSSSASAFATFYDPFDIHPSDNGWLNGTHSDISVSNGYYHHSGLYGGAGINVGFQAIYWEWDVIGISPYSTSGMFVFATDSYKEYPEPYCAVQWANGVGGNIGISGTSGCPSLSFSNVGYTEPPYHMILTLNTSNYLNLKVYSGSNLVGNQNSTTPMLDPLLSNRSVIELYANAYNLKVDNILISNQFPESINGSIDLITFSNTTNYNFTTNVIDVNQNFIYTNIYIGTMPEDDWLGEYQLDVFNTNFTKIISLRPARDFYNGSYPISIFLSGFNQSGVGYYTFQLIYRPLMQIIAESHLYLSNGSNPLPYRIICNLQTICGYVYDNVSINPISNAYVSVGASQTTTNIYGYFSIPYPIEKTDIYMIYRGDYKSQSGYKLFTPGFGYNFYLDYNPTELNMYYNMTNVSNVTALTEFSYDISVKLSNFNKTGYQNILVVAFSQILPIIPIQIKSLFYLIIVIVGVLMILDR